MKERLGLLDGSLEQVVPDLPFARAVDLDEAETLAREAARRAIRVVTPGDGRADAGGRPVRPASLRDLLATARYRGILVLELGEGSRTIAEEGGAPPLRLARALQDRLSGADPAGAGPGTPVPIEEISVPAGTAPGDAPAARERLRQVLGTGGFLPVVVTRNAARHPDQLAWTREVFRLSPDAVTVVAAALPDDLDRIPAPPALFLATYGDQPPHVEAAAAVLSGETDPRHP